MGTASLITTMPHDKMQAYVNVDYSRELSIVALVDKTDKREIIAEARYMRSDRSGYGDVAFVVDEKGRLLMDARVQDGVYRLTIPFEDSPSQAKTVSI